MLGPRMPAGRATAAMFEIGKTISYRGRRHVVVGVTPMGVTPCLVELEDVESGRVRSVQCDDPEIVIDRADSLANANESPEPEV
jgi:hypothetical protein